MLIHSIFWNISAVAIISVMLGYGVIKEASADAPLYTTKQTVELLLPFKKNEFPSLKQKLESALVQHDLSEIKIQFSDHWHYFQQGLRNGHNAIYFAPPHFAAWAINKHNFTPLLRLQEDLQYVIATQRSKSHFFEINDLAGKLICAYKPLNLDYLLINQAFDNNFRSAKIKNVLSVKRHMKSELSTCDAFAVSDHVVRQLEYESPNKFIRLYQGQTFNNYVFIAHPQATSQVTKKLVQFLSKQETQSLLSGALQLYSSDPRLVRSKKRDYPPSYTESLVPYW